jgi:hypothetical protein
VYCMLMQDANALSVTIGTLAARFGNRFSHKV